MKIPLLTRASVGAVILNTEKRWMHFTLPQWKMCSQDIKIFPYNTMHKYIFTELILSLICPGA